MWTGLWCCKLRISAHQLEISQNFSPFPSKFLRLLPFFHFLMFVSKEKQSFGFQYITKILCITYIQHTNKMKGLHSWKTVMIRADNLISEWSGGVGRGRLFITFEEEVQGKIRENQNSKSLTIKRVLDCNTSIALHFYTPRIPLPISLPRPVFSCRRELHNESKSSLEDLSYLWPDSVDWRAKWPGLISDYYATMD